MATSAKKESVAEQRARAREWAKQQKLKKKAKASAKAPPRLVTETCADVGPSGTPRKSKGCSSSNSATGNRRVALNGTPKKSNGESVQEQRARARAWAAVRNPAQTGREWHENQTRGKTQVNTTAAIDMKEANEFENISELESEAFVAPWAVKAPKRRKVASPRRPEQNDRSPVVAASAINARRPWLWAKRPPKTQSGRHHRRKEASKPLSSMLELHPATKSLFGKGVSGSLVVCLSAILGFGLAFFDWAGVSALNRIRALEDVVSNQTDNDDGASPKMALTDERRIIGGKRGAEGRNLD
jgi:hypothetical protein